MYCIEYIFFFYLKKRMRKRIYDKLFCILVYVCDLGLLKTSYICDQKLSLFFSVIISNILFNTCTWR